MHLPACQTNSLIPRLTLADQPRGKGGREADSGLNNKRGPSITPCGTSAYLVIKSRPEGDSPLFVAARGRQAGTPHPVASHAADPHLVNTCSSFLIKVESSRQRAKRTPAEANPRVEKPEDGVALNQWRGVTLPRSSPAKEKKRKKNSKISPPEGLLCSLGNRRVPCLGLEIYFAH